LLQFYFSEAASIIFFYSQVAGKTITGEVLPLTFDVLNIELARMTGLIQRMEIDGLAQQTSASAALQIKVVGGRYLDAIDDRIPRQKGSFVLICCN
jgi:hypothetical protein